ncbi:MAG: hypothetical protein KJ048_18835 [Dehalococcoidia bacterium]|nr:hypothetical protein [Dehalococcoidia bacterium]
MWSHRALAISAAMVVTVTVVGVVLASTASTNGDHSRTGEGQGAISGFDVSTVHYTLNRSDPSKIDGVEFMLDDAPPAGATIRVKIGSTSETWYHCQARARQVSCETTAPPALIELANELKVIVAQ